MNRIGFSQRLELRQTQALVMTPQLQQAIKMLQLSNLELADYVDAEIEQNPLLERTEGDGEDGAPVIESSGGIEVNSGEANGAAPVAEPTSTLEVGSSDFTADAAEQWDAKAGADGDGSADFGTVISQTTSPGEPAMAAPTSTIRPGSTRPRRGRRPCASIFSNRSAPTCQTWPTG